MATGGTGDVLSGVCGALLAQGLSPEDAAVTAVYAHGLAGDLVAKRRGMMGLMASDLLDGLGEVWVRWDR
jgi:NAD(P)H-hydrate epimerase